MAKTKPVPYVYPIRTVIDVHDGDTMFVLVDLGFDTLRRLDVRVNGLDTPEVTGPDKDVGLIVRDVVRTWMARAQTLESQELDKYGRSLAELYNDKGNKLSEFLLTNGMAVTYVGDKKKPWAKPALDAIRAAKDALLALAAKASP